MSVVAGRPSQWTLLLVSVGTSSEADAVLRTMMEANLSSEVALIVLDTVSLFTQHFKVSSAASKSSVKLPLPIG